MEKTILILKSKMQYTILVFSIITGIALAVALPTGYIAVVDFIFKILVNITPYHLSLLSGVLILFFNVVFKLKLSPRIIKACSFSSKIIVQLLNKVVGFCLALLVVNLFFNNLEYSAFFAITGFTTYFIGLATHWMILDLETQSKDLVS
ncbi:hypothetical protein [Acinetobacter baumannii]|uniref:hypothetical protein n=1 Tax=Acinetobacter baumannii TaxID=470 RepID=UPI003AF89FD7